MKKIIYFALVISFIICFNITSFIYAQDQETKQELIGDQFGVVVGKNGGKEVPEAPGEMPVIEIKNDWIYVDGERYFVKGVGYSGWRPYQLPWQERPDPELLENDLRLISEAGFNTIRTWTALNSEELKIAKKYNLMVMQGIFVDPTRDFASPIYQQYVITTIKNQIRYYLEKTNILMFLVANEPPIERVRTSGIENTEKILKLMVNSVHQLDPSKIVTFSNWVQLAFINHSMLPVIAFNVYMYEPDIVKYALTYKGYIEWLKTNIAVDKPLVITEFGLSVAAYGSGNYGRGGNTEEEQRDGVIKMYKDLINAGATGACVFEWNDEWWKNYDYTGDQYKHETSDPEEWYGILEIKDEMSDLKGRVRLSYEALKEFNQAIIINPKNIDFYSGDIKIEVYVNEEVKDVFYRIDTGAWKTLEKVSDHWREAVWDSSNASFGRHILEIKVMDQADVVLVNKKRNFWLSNKPGFVPPKLNVKLNTNKDKYICYGEMQKLILTVTVTDNNGKPVSGIRVDYAFYESRFWQNLHGSAISDKKGKIKVEYYVNESGFINIGAGVTLVDGEYTRRFGDVIAVEVEKCRKETLEIKSTK